MKALDYGFEICGGQLAAKVASGGSWSATVSKTFTSADLNTWRHVAMTYDGATLRFYIDGALIELGSRRAHDDERVAAVRSLDFRREYWNGLIDEVRIYNRVLAQAEVQADFGGSVTPQRGADDLADDTGGRRHVHGAGDNCPCRHRGGQRRLGREGGLL